MTDNDVPALYRLRSLFDDRPDLLEIVTLADAQSHEMADALRTAKGLFADPLNAWATGRTGAGKSSLGNSLCGSAAMPSDGHANCTFEIGVLRTPSNLTFVDTPGGGDDEKYENVTRVALALPLLPTQVPTEIILRDYTAVLSAGGTFTDEAVPTAAWPARATQLEPDVVVFFVAPSLGFMRADREYLREIYRAYGEKVVVALNLFRRDGRDQYTTQNLEDAHKGVAAVHSQVFPQSKTGPRAVEINALTGSGLDELTAAVCAVVPTQKIGRLESVLRDELKPRARKERDRQFRHTVHWIAARLALTQVDHKAWGQDLLALAAVAVAQFAVATFVDPDVTPEDVTDDQLQSSIVTRADAVRESRTEVLTTEEPVFRERDIFENVPEFRSVERTTYSKQIKQTTEREAVPQGLFKSAGVVLRAAYEHVEAFATGGGDDVREGINRRMRRDLNPTVERSVSKEEMVPETRVEQELTGYRKEKVGTITEVADVKVRQVGEKAMQGGVAALELLIGTGAGVRDHLVGDSDGPAEERIAVKTEEVSLALAHLRGRLEGLLAGGPTAESEIVALLDERFAQ